MAPIDRDPAAIVGTLRYDAADLRLIETQFGQSMPMPLWQGALIASGLGAVIGFGVVALAQRLLRPEVDFFAGWGPWGALIGAMAMVSAVAAYITRKAKTPPPHKPQTISVSAEGIRLSTDTADSLMRWPLFTRRVNGDGYMALLTADNTWVLLRPSYFDAPEDLAAALALVEANVA